MFAFDRIKNSQDHMIRVRFDVDRLTWIAEHSNFDETFEMPTGYGSSRHVSHVVRDLKRIFPNADVGPMKG